MSGETLFAEALLAVEPPKVEGGSKPRHDWLGLMVDIQAFLHENGHDMRLFSEVVTGLRSDHGTRPPPPEDPLEGVAGVDGSRGEPRVTT